MELGFDYNLEYFRKCLMEDVPFRIVHSETWSDDPWYIDQQARNFTQDPEYWILNDPNGEADLINGGYVNHTKGAGVKYSRQRFNRRWEVDGASTGWALLVKP